MARSIQSIEVKSKNFGSFDGVKIGISSNLWEELQKRKTAQGNMIDSLKIGRGLNGFKHLIEKIKTHDKKNEIIFTDDETNKKGKRFFINFDKYRRNTSNRFFALYRETGLDGASYFLNINFSKEFKYDKDRITRSQLKKIDKNFPDVLKEMSKKVQNRKVLIQKTTDVLNELTERKAILKSQVEALEDLKNASNIALFQQRIKQLNERLTGKKRCHETRGKNSWQRWIYENNWMFGIHYQKPIEKEKVGFDNIPDFLFPTIDGFLDILEIKLPTADVIHADDSHPGSYRWSSTANQAIGQVINYLHQMELHQFELEKRIRRAYHNQFGSGIFSIKPRAFILIGTKDAWDEDKIEALRKLNYSLHGIEVLTYTDLLARGQQIIDMYTKNIGN